MRLVLAIFFSFILSGMMSAQSGKVFDDLSMHSDVLNMDRKYAIYLPPDYETSTRSYPVLYLLHGGGDDQTGWIQYGEVNRIADQAINDGTATPMIIVMPDANTTQRGYFNSIDGTFKYEDFFFEEFMPHVEKEYRIRAEKQYRAVAGLSMGGGGSFMYALHRPDLFAAACPLSASVGPLDLEQAKVRRSRSKMDHVSDEQLASYYQTHSAITLVENMEAEEIKKVRWYIDCGDDDFLYEGNALVHIAMRKKEVPHEYRVRDGQHNWSYWRAALPSVLTFVTESFHR